MTVAAATTFKPITLFGFRLSETGLEPIGGKVPPREQWAQLIAFLQFMEDATPWLMGDALGFGEAHYGETAAQFVEATGHKLQTIEQYRWVAERVPPARRDPELSFSHHREVADLAPAEQRYYLQRARKEGLSVNALRAAINRTTHPEKKVCWLLVSCASEADRTTLIARLEAEGRSVKIP